MVNILITALVQHWYSADADCGVLDGAAC